MARKLNVEKLVGDLSGPDVDIRSMAATQLGYSQDPRAIGPLVSALDDESGRVRFAAALALGQLEAQVALPRLVEKLREDPVGDVRWQCAYAIGSIAPQEHLDILVEALRDPHPHVRMGVCGVFQSGREYRAIPAMMALLDDLDVQVRISACEALVSLEAVDQRVIDTIEAIRDSPEGAEYEEGMAHASELFSAIMENPELLGCAAKCMGKSISETSEIGFRETLELAKEQMGDEPTPPLPQRPLQDLAERAKLVFESHRSEFAN